MLGQRIRVDAAHAMAGGSPEIGSTDSEPSQATAPSPVDPIAAGLAMLEVVEEPSVEMLAVVAGQTLASQREQLQLQVAQLAGHLRERLKEVDRRESQLNACVAQLEGDLRASRMWFQERELDFQDRELELKNKIAELEAQAASQSRATQQAAQALEEQRREFAAREASFADREQMLRDQIEQQELQAASQQASSQSADQHAEYLQEQQRQFAIREQALATQIEALEAQLAEQNRLAEIAAWNGDSRERQLDEREAELASREQSLAESRQQQERQQLDRESQLQAGEILLVEHAQELDGQRATLAAERQAWQERLAAERQALVTDQEAAASAETQRTERAAARQTYIERQRASLEQVRLDIVTLHKQSLEMRLIAEQVWSQISGRLTPAEATHAIAKLRLELVDRYRCEEDQLQTAKDELIKLSSRVTEQHRELTQLRSGLRDWTSARQAEIETQAAALVERELVLDQQQETMLHSERQWQSARRRYEQQIRELTCQLHSLPAAA